MILFTTAYLLSGLAHLNVAQSSPYSNKTGPVMRVLCDSFALVGYGLFWPLCLRSGRGVEQ